MQQLLHVVEGLEEELFSSEARRNDAEVGASTVLMLTAHYGCCFGMSLALQNLKLRQLLCLKEALGAAETLSMTVVSLQTFVAAQAAQRMHSLPNLYQLWLH